MKLYFIVLVGCLFNTSFAQDSFYDYISLGKYQVGYCDTVIFNADLPYNQYGYEGNAPMFVQIWHPIKRSIKGDYLTIQDFRKRNLPTDLNKVYNELNKQLDEYFIAYNLSWECITEDSIDYGTQSLQEVLKTIQQCPTKSSRAPLITKSTFPTIVFHHGSQGASDDAYFMAEYFASRGFIVVASNFHLPYPDTPFGLIPFALKTEEKINHSTVKTLIRFAKSLSEDTTTFFVGHSWGAQEGWCILHEEGWSKGFVSMETTIEFKDPLDTMTLKDRWPEVYELIKTQEKTFSIPVLLFANTQENQPFHFFVNESSKRMIHASSKQIFTHESYNSTYLMRYFFRDRISVPDRKELKKQLLLYGEHLALINDFFQLVRTNQKIHYRRLNRFFYFN